MGGAGCLPLALRFLILESWFGASSETISARSEYINRYTGTSTELRIRSCWEIFRLVHDISGRVLEFGHQDRAPADPAGDSSRLLDPPEGVWQVLRQVLLLDLDVRHGLRRFGWRKLLFDRGLRLHLRQLLLPDQLRGGRERRRSE